MIKIAWATDIHFDHCDKKAIAAFLVDGLSQMADLILIAGDISSNAFASKVIEDLSLKLKVPIYFVLGNHDFYGQGIEKVRAQIHPALQYLTKQGIIELTPELGLIGHDGWADGRSGDWERSNVLLNDYFYIEDFITLSKSERLEKMQALSNESINHIIPLLKRAYQKYKEVILLTHVPPFGESCLYEGKLSNSEWTPHFVNHSLGIALNEAMLHYPSKKLTLLCGHSHHESQFNPLPNFTVFVGQATYGAPHFQKPLQFPYSL